jgi:hypothetical protein
MTALSVNRAIFELNIVIQFCQELRHFQRDENIPPDASGDKYPARPPVFHG